MTVFENPRNWLKENDYASWLFKYVRFADGVVLFCNGCAAGINHRTIVNSRPEVPAVFAGKIQVQGDGWGITEGGSVTAKLPRGLSDKRYIDRILSKYGFTHNDAL